MTEIPKTKRCAFVDEDGERHDIELTAENSYKGSRYCKAHHNVMMQRSRSSGVSREKHNARVNEWQRKHPEVNQRTQKAFRERQGAGITLATKRGRPRETPGVEFIEDPELAAAINAGLTAPSLPSSFADVAEVGEGWAKPAHSRKRHWFKATGVSLCATWRAENAERSPDEGVTTEHCTNCVRALERRRSTKHKQDKKL